MQDGFRATAKTARRRYSRDAVFVIFQAYAHTHTHTCPRASGRRVLVIISRAIMIIIIVIIYYNPPAGRWLVGISAVRLRGFFFFIIIFTRVLPLYPHRPGTLRTSRSSFVFRFVFFSSLRTYPIRTMKFRGEPRVASKSHTHPFGGQTRASFLISGARSFESAT